MPKKDNRTMPVGYAVCVHADCEQAEHCLRRKAYETMSQTAERMTVVNPERCTKSANCPYFRDSTPVQYARGFKGMRAKMTSNQYNVFRRTLTAAFSQNPYYERMRGDYGLSPREQNVVQSALHKAGIKEELNFDAYETQYDWED